MEFRKGRVVCPIKEAAEHTYSSFLVFKEIKEESLPSSGLATAAWVTPSTLEKSMLSLASPGRCPWLVLAAVPG